jgi:hypothetical protein
VSEPVPLSAASGPKRRRLRFGLRGLIGAVLVLGLVFGWVARMRREAGEREALVAELDRERIRVNHSEPTLLCLALMKVLSMSSVDTRIRCSRWLGPGWFYHPKGFNAGHLHDEQVPHVVERLRRLGVVWEITYTRPPSLSGLKLFYIEYKVPYFSLGPERDTCRFERHPPPVPGE